jgi:hypothetical protein
MACVALLLPSEFGAAATEPVFGAALSGRVELFRLTRVTPSTARRRERSWATWVCVVAQPLSSMAGEAIALRMAEPPAAESLEIEPVSDVSVTSVGMAREMSRSACSQSKREAARSLTVWMRV